MFIFYERSVSVLAFFEVNFNILIIRGWNNISVFAYSHSTI